LIISVKASKRLGVAGNCAAPVRRSTSAIAILNGVGVLGVLSSVKNNGKP